MRCSSSEILSARTAQLPQPDGEVSGAMVNVVAETE